MLFYLSLVTNSFDVFDCVGSGSDKRMATEPSIRCSESDADYSKLRALSYISFVVYVGGIPLLILGGMFWSQRKLNVIHRASNVSGITSSRAGTEVHGSSVSKDIAKEILLMTSRHFKPQYYFWTAILMGRNLLVIVLIRTVPSDRKCSMCWYLPLPLPLLTSLIPNYLFSCNHDRTSDSSRHLDFPLLWQCFVAVLLSAVCAEGGRKRPFESHGVCVDDRSSGGDSLRDHAQQRI